MASEKQVNFINKLKEERHITETMLNTLENTMEKMNGGQQVDLTNVETLSSSAASFLINFMLDQPTRKQEAREQQRFDNAMNKYEALIEWAKTQNVPVRKRMKKVTVVQKIKEAGLEIPAELR